MAHVDYKGKYRVGRYGVDLSLFEAMALPVLERALQEKEIIVIDEIGKMELLSQRFREVVIQILDQGQRHLLGVIHQKREPFADSIKKREDVEVTVVNYQNRDELPSQIIMRLKRQRG